MPRNYYRSPSDVTFTLPGFTRAVKILIITTGCVFFAQALAGEIALLAPLGYVLDWMMLRPSLFIHGALWQPFTYLFLHASFGHLLGNMLGLWLLGVSVEQALGERRFYALYFVSGVGAGLIDVASHLWFRSSGAPTVGASGAVFGIITAFGILFPEQKVFLAIPPVMIKGKWLAVLFGAIEFLASFGSGDNISHVAHVGGILFGLMFMRSRLPFGRLREQYALWRRRRLQRRFQIYMTKRDRRPGSGGDWIH